MKSDDMLNQAPADDAYADIEAFVGGGSPETVEQVDPEAPTPAELPEEEVRKEATSVNLGPGQIDVMDTDALDREEARLKAQLELLEMKPEQAYLRRLELEGIELAEARRIIDTIMVQLEQYQERVMLTKNLSAVIQTRKASDQAMLANVIEARQPRYNMTFDYIAQVQNVAASLVRYGKQEFVRETKEDGEKLIAWLENLPIPIFYLLVEKVREFDQKISIVFQEGYLENF